MLNCPKCKSNQVIPILYGMPGMDAFEDEEKGKVKLAGCVVTDSDPNQYCKKCKHKWLKAEC